MNGLPALPRLDVTPELLAYGLGVTIVLAMLTLVVALARGGAGTIRAEAEATRAALAQTERALAARAESTRIEDRAALHDLSTRLLRDQADQRLLMETKLREMGDLQAARLAEIQRSVNETLTANIEKQMHGSFQRVIDQFAQVQKAMVDVQAVTTQIGDLRRIFSNVKTRGAWGEMQLQAMLTDSLPPEAWRANCRLRPDTGEVVEFALVMPSRLTPSPLLAIDAKFPAEDYDRLLLAAEAGDQDGERAARRGLEARLRLEARSIAAKYIVPPVTVDFAILYLPTDGLYVEAARMPGLIEGLNRDHRILVMGPSLLPALLRTIQLGALTLTMEERTEQISRLLGAVRTEFGRMDTVLARLEKQAGSVSTTVVDARRRARAMERTLRGVASLSPDDAASALLLEEPEPDAEAGAGTA